MNTDNPYLSPQSGVNLNEPQQDIGAYATFLQRFAAFLIDLIITVVLSLILGVLLGVVVGFTGAGIEIIELLGNILGIAVGWLYSALLESSEQQATWGKQAMKIKVTDLNGNRISFGRASGRHFAQIISTLIIFIGYFMMLWTKDKQTLHDIISGCLVTQNKY